VHIYIPTYRRVDRQWTLRELPPNWLKKTTLVIDETDYKPLRRITKDIGVDLLVHPPNITSIAKKRAWIIKVTDETKILMLDDDLRFCKRRYKEDGIKYQILKSVPEEVDWCLRQVDLALNRFAHVGIGPRQGNNQIKERYWRMNGRMIYALGYRPDIVREVCKLGRIEHREDMDYTLQLLRAGYENKVLVDMCLDQQYNGRGGASEQRSMEASNADALKLAKLHPKLVKVTSKEYSHSIPRNEVICYWRKAIEQGEKKYGIQSVR
jgi:hypothetical protein